MDFSNMKVLVIGDIALDIIEDGISNRLSPEAPVPVILNSKTEYSLGMAGNVALNLKNLGADVYLFSYFTDCFHGGKILDLLNNNGIKIFRSHKPDNKKRAIIKKRILANGKHVARMDYEKKISEEDSLTYVKRNILPYVMNSYDLVIISDYNKGFINNDTWKEISPLVWEKNKGRIFVDTKKKNAATYYEGCILTPNDQEGNNILEYYNVSSYYELLLELDSDMIIKTASANGAYLFKKDKVLHSKALESQVVDVTGCGDTFISSFALYFTKFGNNQKSLDFANYCCSKVINKKGTSSISYKEAKDFELKEG